MERPDPDDVVYQPRCIYCKGEHYALGVPAISHGDAGCYRCGRVPPVFTSETAYRAALREGWF